MPNRETNRIVQHIRDLHMETLQKRFEDIFEFCYSRTTIEIQKAVNRGEISVEIDYSHILNKCDIWPAVYALLRDKLFDDGYAVLPIFNGDGQLEPQIWVTWNVAFT